MSVRWRRWLGLLVFSLVAVCVVGLLLIETGIVQRWVRHVVVSQIEQGTGARVDLGGFHLHIWKLRAELDDLTLHGLEAPGTPPLFHTAHVNVDIHILSLAGKEIAIDELVFDQPQLAVRVDKNGKSNLPTPRVAQSKRPWRETLFSLRIGHLEFRDGGVTFNDRSAPLATGKTCVPVTSRRGIICGTGIVRRQPAMAANSAGAGRDLPLLFDISASTLHPVRSNS